MFFKELKLKAPLRVINKNSLPLRIPAEIENYSYQLPPLEEAFGKEVAEARTKLDNYAGPNQYPTEHLCKDMLDKTVAAKKANLKSTWFRFRSGFPLFIQEGKKKSNHWLKGLLLAGILTGVTGLGLASKPHLEKYVAEYQRVPHCTLTQEYETNWLGKIILTDEPQLKLEVGFSQPISKISLYQKNKITLKEWDAPADNGSFLDHILHNYSFSDKVTVSCAFDDSQRNYFYIGLFDSDGNIYPDGTKPISILCPEQSRLDQKKDQQKKN